MQKLIVTLCLSILLAQLQTITGGDTSRTRGRVQSDRTGDRTAPPSATAVMQADPDRAPDAAPVLDSAPSPDTAAEAPAASAPTPPTVYSTDE